MVMAFIPPEFMHISNVPSGFGTNNGDSLRLRHKGSIQLQQIYGTICTPQPLFFMQRDAVWWAERNFAIPVCLKFDTGLPSFL